MKIGGPLVPLSPNRVFWPFLAIIVWKEDLRAWVNGSSEVRHTFNNLTFPSDKLVKNGLKKLIYVFPTLKKLFKSKTKSF